MLHISIEVCGYLLLPILILILVSIEDVCYEQLQKYLTTDEERWDNNYPKESPDKAGCAVFKERKGSENGRCIIASLTVFCVHYPDLIDHNTVVQVAMTLMYKNLKLVFHKGHALNLSCF